MATLLEVQNEADQLSHEDRAGLIAHLINSLPNPPQGADDEEVLKREAEMDTGIVQPITHEEFLDQALSKDS